MIDRALALVGLRGAPRAVSEGQVVSCPLRLSGRVSVERCLACPWGAVHLAPGGDRIDRVACGAGPG